MAGRLGVTSSRYLAEAVPPAAPTDDSNPYFRFDSNLCIVCSRCVRACDEIQGTFALTIAGRGHASRVVASQDDPWRYSECVSCGQCVESCPTGALLETSSSSVSRNVQQRVVTDMPLLARNVLMLVNLSPGITNNSPTSASTLRQTTATRLNDMNDHPRLRMNFSTVSKRPDETRR